MIPCRTQGLHRGVSWVLHNDTMTVIVRQLIYSEKACSRTRTSLISRKKNSPDYMGNSNPWKKRPGRKIWFPLILYQLCTISNFLYSIVVINRSKNVNSSRVLVSFGLGITVEPGHHTPFTPVVHNSTYTSGKYSSPHLIVHNRRLILQAV